MSARLEIRGPAGEIDSVFKAIESGHFPNVKIVEFPRERTEIFDRSLYRENLWAYGVIVFIGHLSAALAHDYVKALIDKIYPKNKIELDVKDQVKSDDISKSGS